MSGAVLEGRGGCVSRLLVVDDDPVVLNLVTMRLKSGGHRVLVASDPFEALRLVDERGLPDLAVLDVTLPGMTGLELFHELRRRPGGQALPTIFLSARVQARDIEAGRALGATYLTKPFVASALLTAVERELASVTTVAPTGW
jgi:CheY-like chemotaxis protein